MHATRDRVYAAPRLLAGFAIGFAVATAGTAFASNHDAQRVSVHCSSTAAKHDRALGPVASADTNAPGVN